MMKMKWFAGAALAAAMVFGVSVPAHAQIGVYIGRTPPPLRVEVRPNAPGPGYAWTEGYWGNQGGRYVWVGGRWQQPPYEGATWNHPHYDHYRQGWQYHEGRWDNDHHEDHHDDHR